MGNQFALIYSDRYANTQFPPGHPISPDRFVKPFKLFQKNGLINHPRITLVEPIPATKKEILRIHTPEYVNLVMKLSETGVGEIDPDTPAFKGMYEYGLLSVGGTLTGLRWILEGKATQAINICGGFHHAYADKGGGFCLFNDCAIAIQELLDQGYSRILYLDTDLHHGDGTQEIFNHDHRVMTISIHEDGRYLFPGKGFIHEIGIDAGKGYSVNIPLPPGTKANHYQKVFDSLIPTFFNSFNPEFILWQAGLDGHMSDPLGDLDLDLNLYRHLAKTVRVLAEKHCQGKLLALGGGGYNIKSTAHGWTAIIRMLATGEISELDDFEETPGHIRPLPIGPGSILGGLISPHIDLDLAIPTLINKVKIVHSRWFQKS